MIFYASAPHYFHHLYPIWHQLTPHIPFYISRDDQMHQLAQQFITPGYLYTWPLPRGNYPVIVSSYQDYLSTKSRPVIFVEHGAGQTYKGLDSGSYSGGSGRDRTILFLVPNITVANNNSQVYPFIPNAVVGCAALDYLFPIRNHPSTIHSGHPNVVISFHNDFNYLPEMRSAFDHYSSIIPSLAINDSFHLIGHAHPKATHIPHYYAKHNIPFIAHWPDVIKKADLIIVDNSSILYEAAALDIPTITLNAPWYRRTVHHGLRFWSDIPGPQCNNPSELLDLIHITLTDPHPWPQFRRQIASKVYDPVVGGSKLAADAIREAV